MSDKTYSASEVETLLEISEPTRQRMAKMGLLTPEKVGRTQVFSAEEVDRWRNAPAAPRDRALIVRMGLPDVEEDTGRKFGWFGPILSEARNGDNGRAFYTPQEQRDAVRMWWRIADPESFIGKPLVAAVSDWAVGAWVIKDATRNAWGYVCFDVAEDQETLERWELTRLNLPRGPVGAIRWPRPE